MGAAMVKVWNDNKFPFRQQFKDALIEIPAGESIEMQWDDAVEFKSAYFPPTFKGDGSQNPESYKMIRIDGLPPHLRKEVMQEIICGSCGDKFGTEEDLDAHIDRHHLDELEDQDVAQKRRARKKA